MIKRWLWKFNTFNTKGNFDEKTSYKNIKKNE